MQCHAMPVGHLSDLASTALISTDLTSSNLTSTDLTSTDHPVEFE
jgi:hypothetical protein